MLLAPLPALFCGTPVVTTNWGAAPELVEHVAKVERNDRIGLVQPGGDVVPFSRRFEIACLLAGLGAVEAGAPEFIDLLTSENEKYQLKLGGGIFWLDNYCTDHYGKVFLDCPPEQKKEVLDLIAFRKNAKQDPSLSQGVSFSSFLRNMTCDGYYTSKIGMADLRYMGNTSLREFPGCPPLPE